MFCPFSGRKSTGSVVCTGHQPESLPKGKGWFERRGPVEANERTPIRLPQRERSFALIVNLLGLCASRHKQTYSCLAHVALYRSLRLYLYHSSSFRWSSAPPRGRSHRPVENRPFFQTDEARHQNHRILPRQAGVSCGFGVPGVVPFPGGSRVVGSGHQRLQDNVQFSFGHEKYYCKKPQEAPRSPTHRVGPLCNVEMDRNLDPVHVDH